MRVKEADVLTMVSVTLEFSGAEADLLATLLSGHFGDGDDRDAWLKTSGFRTDVAAMIKNTLTKVGYNESK